MILGALPSGLGAPATTGLTSGGEASVRESSVPQALRRDASSSMDRSLPQDAASPGVWRDKFSTDGNSSTISKDSMVNLKVLQLARTFSYEDDYDDTADGLEIGVVPLDSTMVESCGNAEEADCSATDASLPEEPCIGYDLTLSRNQNRDVPVRRKDAEVSVSGRDGTSLAHKAREVKERTKHTENDAKRVSRPGNGRGSAGDAKQSGGGRGSRRPPSAAELRARKRNDVNKASRANHSRKKGAAKKISMGMV